MNDNILATIKKMLGVPDSLDAFDEDIVVDINSVFNILLQLGVGPKEGFFITTKEEKWSDFVTDMTKLQMVKTYIYLKVRLMFDPPTAGPMISNIQSQISELEWRLNVQVDPGKIW